VAEATPASPLSLKPDFHEAAARWEAFWAGEMLDRPPVIITCPEPGAEPGKRPTYWTMLNDPIEEVVAGLDTYMHAIHWGGDAMPLFSPGFGPDIFASFLGAEIAYMPDFEHRTSWAVTFVEDWREVLPLRIHEESRYWTHLRALMQRMAEVGAGKWLVAHLDLHSNMDALEAIRGASRFCVDLYDYPDLVAEANDQVRALYAPIYDTLYLDGGMDRVGTGGWIPAFHAGRTNTIQCDFAALVGPEHFRRYILPDLEAESTHLEHCVYHWDGPSSLVHMDDLMAIRGIDCFQWVPGAGNPPLVEWLDLLEAVQQRGKSVMVYCSVEEVPAFHQRLRPDRMFYSISAANREQLERTVEWITENS